MAIGRQHDRYCTLGGGVWLPSPLRPQDVAVAIGSRTGRRESPRPAKAASEVPRSARGVLAMFPSWLDAPGRPPFLFR